MNLHVIIGRDDYLVEMTAKKIIGDGVGLEVIDSRSSGNAEQQLHDLGLAFASFSTPPMFDPRKVTWWKNVHFLPGGNGKKATAEDVKVALEKFAERLAASPLPENQHFILSGPGLLKTSVFAKRVSTIAEVVVFGDDNPRTASGNAVMRVMDFAKDRGLQFAPGAAEKFVARVGNDTRSQLNELDKLRCYLGEQSATIDAAAIEAVTSQGVGVEAEIWAITDAAGRRNLKSLMLAVKEFEGESGFAVLTTSVVEKFFRQLVELKQSESAARGSQSLPWIMRKQLEYLRYWTLSELRTAWARFMNLRERAVSSTDGIDDLVVANLVRVCRRPR